MDRSETYNGEKTFDFEEVGIATKEMSFEDYLSLRSIALMVEALYNGKPFDEFFQFRKGPIRSEKPQLERARESDRDR